MPEIVATGVRDIFVEANGIRHHLIARGSQGTPVVVMLHGLAGQAHVFDAAATALAARNHVYCMDIRGRGESNWGPMEGYNVATYVADLEAVRTALGIGRFTLVGTGLGGIIAMNYATTHPENVAGIVVNDVGPELEAAGVERILKHVAEAPEMFADMKAVLKYYRELYVHMVEHIHEDALAEFARHNVRKNDNGLFVWKMDPVIRREAAPSLGRDPWGAFARIGCPVLVFRGERSDVLSAETAAKMASSLKDSEVVTVPGVGHAPTLTEPAAMDALGAFLGRV